MRAEPAGRRADRGSRPWGPARLTAPGTAADSARRMAEASDNDVRRPAAASPEELPVLRQRRIPETNILEFELDGDFRREEFEDAARAVDEIIEQEGSVRLIEIFRDIGRIEPAAAWAEMKWAPGHLSKLSHVAIVADRRWIEWMVGPIAALTPMQVRTFHLDEIEEARQWVRSAA